MSAPKIPQDARFGIYSRRILIVAGSGLEPGDTRQSWGWPRLQRFCEVRTHLRRKAEIGPARWFPHGKSDFYSACPGRWRSLWAPTVCPVYLAGASSSKSILPAVYLLSPLSVCSMVRFIRILLLLSWSVNHRGSELI